MELPRDNTPSSQMVLLEKAFKLTLILSNNGYFKAALKNAENGNFTLLQDFFKNHPQFAPKEEVATEELGKEPQEA